jgi:hypothetical protein
VNFSHATAPDEPIQPVRAELLGDHSNSSDLGSALVMAELVLRYGQEATCCPERAASSYSATLNLSERRDVFTFIEEFAFSGRMVPDGSCGKLSPGPSHTPG